LAVIPQELFPPEPLVKHNHSQNMLARPATKSRCLQRDHGGAYTWVVLFLVDALQNSLDPKLFVRISRGTLVRLDAIRELLPWFHGEYKVVLHDSTELRWSRRYVSQRPELLKLP